MHVIFCCSTTLDSAESLHQGGKAPLSDFSSASQMQSRPLFPVQRQVDRKGSPRLLRVSHEVPQFESLFAIRPAGIREW